MTFEEILDQAMALLQRRGRVMYRMLQRQFQLDDDTLADLLAELRYAHRDVISEDEQGIAWTGGGGASPHTPSPSVAAVPGRCLSGGPCTTGAGNIHSSTVS